MVSIKPPFEVAFDKYLKKMEGVEIYTFSGKKNKIVEVNKNQITRKSSESNLSSIPLDIIRKVFNNIVKDKEITREQINAIYAGPSGDSKRGSSFIFGLLSTLPFFDILDKNNATLSLNKDKYQEFWDDNIKDYKEKNE